MLLLSVILSHWDIPMAFDNVLWVGHGVIPCDYAVLAIGLGIGLLWNEHCTVEWYLSLFGHLFPSSLLP